MQRYLTPNNPLPNDVQTLIHNPEKNSHVYLLTPFCLFDVMYILFEQGKLLLLFSIFLARLAVKASNISTSHTTDPQRLKNISTLEIYYFLIIKIIILIKLQILFSSLIFFFFLSVIRLIRVHKQWWLQQRTSFSF